MSDFKDELETFKARATQMGISYSPNIGLEALRKKVSDKLNSVDTTAVKDEPVTNKKGLSMEELQHKNRENSIKEAMKLVRCVVTCNNPNKKHLQGEVITAGNAIMEDTRFIPFNVPWHVPQITLGVLKDREYQMHRKEKTPKGFEITRAKLMPEFNIEILPPLSTEEYNAIRNSQLARGADNQ